jgi:photosystem II stability/assembly factor-like uncharacterized protein
VGEVRSDSAGCRAGSIAEPAGTQPGKEQLEAAGWQDLGLFGGSVKDIAASPTHPEIVLAGLDAFGNGLYRSNDGGHTWSSLPNFPYGVFDVEFSPDGTAYIAAATGIWKGTNDATNWQLVFATGGYAREVTLDPHNPDNIWVGLDAISGGHSVAHSLNGGQTWQNATPLLPFLEYLSCTGIAIHPNDSNIVLACFGGAFGLGQVWGTDNGGASWSYRSFPLPNNPMNDIVFEGTRALVCGGQEFGGQNVGLWASNNNGLVWLPIHNLAWPSRVARDIEVDPQHPGTILVATAKGLLRTTDDGATWTGDIGGTQAISLNAVRFRPGAPNDLFLGAEAQGVLQSQDGGEHFAPSSTGIRALDVHSVAANPNDPRELAAAFQGLNSGGILTSRDGGQTWAMEPAPPTRYDLVRFHANGTLYAISDGPSTIAPEGVYRRNAGGTWTALGPFIGPLFETEFLTLRSSSNQPSLLLAGGDDFLTGRPCIYRSTNLGVSWRKVYTGPPPEFIIHQVSDIEIVEDGTDLSMLAMLYSGDNPMLHSFDSGFSWFELPNGLPAGLFGYRLSGTPADPLTFYIANRGGFGMFRSTDAGLHWSNVGPQYLIGVAGDPGDARVVYGTLGFTSPRVIRSVDGGATFANFSGGLPAAVGAADIDLSQGACPALLLPCFGGAFRYELDSTPPEISVVLDRTALWPPNHKMAPIHATVTVGDNCDENPTFVLTSITSDPAPDLRGDGNTGDDIQGAAFGTADLDFELRCERSGIGTGRRYTVTYTVTDASGNTSSVSVPVDVPHDQSGQALASAGFLPSGTGFAPDAHSFLLVVPSSAMAALGLPPPASLDPARCAVGNHLGEVHPSSHRLVSVDADGQPDLALEFPVQLTLGLRGTTADPAVVGLRTVDGSGAGTWVPDIFALGVPVALGGRMHRGPADETAADAPDEASIGVPQRTALVALRPNPFNPSTTVSFDLAAPQHATVTVYNSRGVMVRRLIAAALPAGRHHITWDGRDTAGASVSSGVYLFRFETPTVEQTRKAVLMK